MALPTSYSGFDLLTMINVRFVVKLLIGLKPLITQSLV